MLYSWDKASYYFFLFYISMFWKASVCFVDIYSELISVDGAFSKQLKWRK